MLAALVDAAAAALAAADGACGGAAAEDARNERRRAPRAERAVRRAVAATLATANGEFAFVFFHSATRTLHFGRDRHGRRSLVMATTTRGGRGLGARDDADGGQPPRDDAETEDDDREDAPLLELASVVPSDDALLAYESATAATPGGGRAWEEVPPSGVFTLALRRCVSDDGNEEDEDEDEEDEDERIVVGGGSVGRGCCFYTMDADAAAAAASTAREAADGAAQAAETARHLRDKGAQAKARTGEAKAGRACATPTPDADMPTTPPTVEGARVNWPCLFFSPLFFSLFDRSSFGPACIAGGGGVRALSSVLVRWGVRHFRGVVGCGCVEVASQLNAALARAVAQVPELDRTSIELAVGA